MDVEALLNKIEQAYTPLIRLYRSVPVTAVEAESLPNGWLAKDLLGHIAAWEWHCAEALERARQTGNLPSTNVDFNAMNREIYEERQEWSWEDIEYDFRAAHDAVLMAIRHLPVDLLVDEAVQYRIKVDTWQHYADHFKELQAWHRRVSRNR